MLNFSNKSEMAIFADAIVPADLVRFSPLILAAIRHRQILTKATHGIYTFGDWTIYLHPEYHLRSLCNAILALSLE